MTAITDRAVEEPENPNMEQEVRRPKLARSVALFVALLCFVAAQAVWTVPLHALTHCGLTQPVHHQMAHDMTGMSSHDCCPEMSGAADCTHPAVMNMAGCADSQSCCRIEQEHRVPKPTSSLGADRSQASPQPEILTITRSPEHLRSVSAAPLPHLRPVLDQKSDLRI